MSANVENEKLSKELLDSLENIHVSTGPLYQGALI